MALVIEERPAGGVSIRISRRGRRGRTLVFSFFCFSSVMLCLRSLAAIIMRVFVIFFGGGSKVERITAYDGAGQAVFATVYSYVELMLQCRWWSAVRGQVNRAQVITQKASHATAPCFHIKAKPKRCPTSAFRVSRALRTIIGIIFSARDLFAG